MNPNKNSPASDEEILRELLSNPRSRRHAARRNHLLFFHIYFPHYARYATAPFQREMLELVEDPNVPLECFVAFRGSGKSTLITLSYSLWSILGMQQQKFVVIVCQTQTQARQQMANIREELENNSLLKSDMGPFREEPGGQWSAASIVFTNTGARITVASVEQPIRGLRHKEYRPGVVILDDIEDYASTRTREGREKTFEWFTREIVPLGDVGTRTIIVSNFLHEDSLVMRLRRGIEEGRIDGLYRWFPIMGKDGVPLWREKFDSPEKIEALHRRVVSEVAWRQEYMLEPASDHTRAVHPEWIRYYDELPPPDDSCYHVVAVDLAISEEKRRDYTAMVIARVFGDGDTLRAYILPNPVHVRSDFPTVVQKIKDLGDSLPGRKEILVESVGFQEAYTQQLRHDGYTDVRSMKPIVGTDKRERLALMSTLIQDGRMRFASEGNEEMVAELTDFGKGHDDLADAVGMVGRYLLGPKPDDGYRGLLEYYKDSAMRAKLSPEPKKPERPVFRISQVVGLLNQQNRLPFP